MFAGELFQFYVYFPSQLVQKHKWMKEIAMKNKTENSSTQDQNSKGSNSQANAAGGNKSGAQTGSDNSTRRSSQIGNGNANNLSIVGDVIPSSLTVNVRVRLINYSSNSNGSRRGSLSITASTVAGKSMNGSDAASSSALQHEESGFHSAPGLDYSSASTTVSQFALSNSDLVLAVSTLMSVQPVPTSSTPSQQRQQQQQQQQQQQPQRRPRPSLPQLELEVSFLPPPSPYHTSLHSSFHHISNTSHFHLHTPNALRTFIASNRALSLPDSFPSLSRSLSLLHPIHITSSTSMSDGKVLLCVSVENRSGTMKVKVEDLHIHLNRTKYACRIAPSSCDPSLPITSSTHHIFHLPLSDYLDLHSHQLFHPSSASIIELEPHEKHNFVVSIQPKMGQVSVQALHKYTMGIVREREKEMEMEREKEKERKKGGDGGGKGQSKGQAMTTRHSISSTNSTLSSSASRLSCSHFRTDFTLTWSTPLVSTPILTTQDVEWQLPFLVPPRAIPSSSSSSFLSTPPPFAISLEHPSPVLLHHTFTVTIHITNTDIEKHQLELRVLPFKNQALTAGTGSAMETKLNIGNTEQHSGKKNEERCDKEKEEGMARGGTKKGNCHSTS